MRKGREKVQMMLLGVVETRVDRKQLGIKQNDYCHMTQCIRGKRTSRAVDGPWCIASQSRQANTHTYVPMLRTKYYFYYLILSTSRVAKAM